MPRFHSALTNRPAGIVSVGVTVTDLPVRTVDVELSMLPLGDRTSPIDRVSLSGGETGYTLGAFTPPSPLIAVWNDVDVIIFSHVAGCDSSFALDLPSHYGQKNSSPMTNPRKAPFETGVISGGRGRRFERLPFPLGCLKQHHATGYNKRKSSQFSDLFSFCEQFVNYCPFNK